MSANRGIFVMDPGGATGLAWGIFDVSPDTSLVDTLKGGLHKGSETIEGDEYKQIRDIAQLWVAFYRLAVLDACLDPTEVEFVCEDFIARPDTTPGKESISPLRIAWGVEGYRMGRADEFKGRRNSRYKVHAPPMIFQMPSDGLAFGRGRRLKEWDLWIVGREHERSAFKHLAYRVSKIKHQRQYL